MRLCAAVLSLLASVAVAAPAPARIAILKSQGLEPYAEAVTAFSLEARADMTEYDLRSDEERARKAVDAVRASKPSLVWALGPYAATLARREFADVPLVFSLVPTHDRYDLAGPTVTGISLTRTPRAQLDTIHALAPDTRTVGVVFDPRSSTLLFEEAQRAAVEVGVALIPARVKDASEVTERLGALDGKVDALWMLPDRTVATVEVFERVLFYARSRKVPLFALSEEQVRSGALVSLSPDPAAIGRQAARIANRIVVEGVPPRVLPVVDPEIFVLSVNVTAAKALPNGQELALDLLGFAGRRKFPVRVYE